MPVPPDVTVCRFVRSQDWNSRDERPKPSAFKGPDISVWDVGRLQGLHVNPEELCIGPLSGAGEARHTVQDYSECARDAASNGVHVTVEVEWRPEDEHVWEPWHEWRDAHAQVEPSTDDKRLPLEVRELLAKRSRWCREPSQPL